MWRDVEERPIIFCLGGLGRCRLDLLKANLQREEEAGARQESRRAISFRRGNVLFLRGLEVMTKGRRCFSQSALAERVNVDAVAARMAQTRPGCPAGHAHERR